MHPDRIGPYRVLRLLDEGRATQVYLAELRGAAGFAKRVAVTRIRSEQLADPQTRAALEEGARLAAHLTHPNVVDVFDLGRDGDQTYLVMEWVDGKNLRWIHDALQRGGYILPVPLVAFVGTSLADALQHAHERPGENGQSLRIVHRNLSPVSVLVSKEGNVKLADFGTGWALERTIRTEVGIVRGQSLYMSPEQLRADPVDARSDVFGLGVVMFELLTGRRPFDGRNDQEIAQHVVHSPEVDLRSINPRVPVSLRDVVHRALEKDPNRRWQSARSMGAALDDVLHADAPLTGAHDLGQLLGQLST